jgi:hypothetical protein
MCEIEQAGLLGPLLNYYLEVIAGLTKILLDAASNGAEPCNE